MSNDDVLFSVICNYDGAAYRLTYGKKYDVYELSNNAGTKYYKINDDKYKYIDYRSSLFITIDEYREKQLEILGI